MKRHLATFLLLFLSAGIAWQLHGSIVSWPSWTHSWGKSALPRGVSKNAKPLDLAALWRLRPTWTAGGLPFPARKNSQGIDSAPGEDLLAEVFASVRNTETMQYQAAIADWESHLEALIARRMAAARLSWDEKYRDLAIRLGEESDRQLTEYAAEVRREYFPTVSALEMQLTLCGDPAQREELQAKLQEVQSTVEGKIAARREELDRQCAQELQDLRDQATNALTALASSLREQAQTALRSFETAQENAHRSWLAQHSSAEEKLRSGWY